MERAVVSCLMSSACPSLALNVLLPRQASAAAVSGHTVDIKTSCCAIFSLIRHFCLVQFICLIPPQVFALPWWIDQCGWQTLLQLVCSINLCPPPHTRTTVNCLLFVASAPITEADVKKQDQESRKYNSAGLHLFLYCISWRSPTTTVCWVLCHHLFALQNGNAFTK